MELLKGKVSKGQLSSKITNVLKEWQKSIPDGPLEKAVSLTITQADDFDKSSRGEIPRATKDLLWKLQLYLDGGAYNYTESYVISEDDYNKIQDASAILGPGYFAVTFSDRHSIMIRDVCVSRTNIIKLEGSVDCSKERIAKAIEIRKNIIEVRGAKKLAEFLNNNCSKEVKQFMVTEEFRKGPPKE